MMYSAFKLNTRVTIYSLIKTIYLSFLTAEQLRENVGPCLGHIFLKVRRPPRPHMCRKGSLEAKGELCQGMFYSDAFSVKSILAKRCMLTHGRILKYTKYGL